MFTLCNTHVPLVPSDAGGAKGHLPYPIASMVGG